jgi:hypothetical protein
VIRGDYLSKKQNASSLIGVLKKSLMQKYALANKNRFKRVRYFTRLVKRSKKRLVIFDYKYLLLIGGGPAFARDDVFNWSLDSYEGSGVNKISSKKKISN